MMLDVTPNFVEALKWLIIALVVFGVIAVLWRAIDALYKSQPATPLPPGLPTTSERARARLREYVDTSASPHDEIIFELAEPLWLNLEERIKTLIEQQQAALASAQSAQPIVINNAVAAQPEGIPKDTRGDL